MQSDELFDAYLRLEPEEGTTLGADAGADRLRDGSIEGLERRAAFFREALASLSADEPPSLGLAPDDERLDREAFARLARYELHLDETPWRWSSPRWCLYPYTMIRHQRATSGGDGLARAAQIAGYLRDDAERLREGARRGHVAHAALLTYQRDVLLPAAADYFERLDGSAASAYRAHIALHDELLARAPVDGSLGPDEHDRRWSLSFELPPPSELEALARDALELTKARLLEVARALADAPIRDFADAAALVRHLQQERLTEGTDLRAHYRAILARVAAFAGERGLFDVGDALDAIGMDDYPEGMRALGAGTNWPAPLLRSGGRGHFVLHPEPSAHPAAWSAILAIHEGIPGHFLQSRIWQRRFAGARAPLRFACVADEVAIPRAYFGAMLTVEGWAVHAEEVVRAAGFHPPRDALFALVAHALRAARVVGDIGLHRRTLSAEQVAAFLVENVGYAPASAAMEAERYAQAPLQAVTYFAGAHALGALAAEHGGDAQAHDRLCAFGPVQPAAIARALVAGS